MNNQTQNTNDKEIVEDSTTKYELNTAEDYFDRKPDFADDNELAGALAKFIFAWRES